MQPTVPTYQGTNLIWKLGPGSRKHRRNFDGSSGERFGHVLLVHAKRASNPHVCDEPVRAKPLVPGGNNYATPHSTQRSVLRVIKFCDQSPPPTTSVLAPKFSKSRRHRQNRCLYFCFHPSWNMVLSICLCHLSVVLTLAQYNFLSLSLSFSVSLRLYISPPFPLSFFLPHSFFLPRFRFSFSVPLPPGCPFSSEASWLFSPLSAHRLFSLLVWVVDACPW